MKKKVLRKNKAVSGYHAGRLTIAAPAEWQTLNFSANVCKTVRLLLSDRCMSVSLSVCLSVLSVGKTATLVYCGQTVGWINETWHGGRPRPWPHCVRWGPSSPSPIGAQPRPIFGPCLLWPNGWMDLDCHLVRRSGWIKMPRGTKVGFSPGHIVLNGDPAPPQKKGTVPQFSAHVYCGQTVAHLSYCWALVRL